MRTALLSDIHSNLEALLAVITALREASIDRVVFLGDIVGYGASPNECIRLIDGLADTIIAGNHDWACAGKDNIQSFNPRARTAAEWTRKELTAENKAFLLSLPLKEKYENSVFVHSTPYFPESWDYVTSSSDAALCFESFSAELCFIGHSHIPAVFTLQPDHKIISETPEALSLSEGSRYIINCGSIGQPRDKNPMAAYGIHDSGDKTFQLKRVAYDIQTAQKKILAAGLPEFLAKRLESGT